MKTVLYVLVGVSALITLSVMFSMTSYFISNLMNYTWSAISALRYSFEISSVLAISYLIGEKIWWKYL